MGFRSALHAASAVAAVALLASCGGSDEPIALASSESGTARRMSADDVPLSQRIAAATSTANSETNSCAAIKPFYWEIGDSEGVLAAGSRAGAGARYTSATRMNIASASKWLYSSYFVQRQNGVLTDADLRMLQMRSGYTSFSVCYPYQTVRGCLNYADNGEYVPSHDGLFYYDGGHMQKHAVVNGLGRLDRQGLTAEVIGQLGTNLSLQYGLPAVAGGAFGTPKAYAAVLRKMMRGDLLIGGMLGTNPVCTNPQACPSEAAFSPSPVNENWHYSIGHWVEDDPVVGDGAFSSPGSLGFYPWIDGVKRFYGIVAREAEFGYTPSIACGRLVRRAWQSGMPQ